MTNRDEPSFLAAKGVANTEGAATPVAASGKVSWLHTIAEMQLVLPFNGEMLVSRYGHWGIG